MNIIDFSPEWDYTTGGSKVLICLNRALPHVFGRNDLEQQFECAFGETVVPVRFVQAGVIKCNAPPNDSPGFVTLNILRNSESITVDSSTQFEYRS